MRRKTLYITDLDGTLLNDSHQISPASRTLLNHAVSRGALVSIATARTPATVNEILRGIDLRIPAVVMTGAALWDIHTRQYSDVQYFTPDQVEKVIEAYLSTDSGAFLYTLEDRAGMEAAAREVSDKLLSIYHFGEMTEAERHFMNERIGNPYKVFHVDPSVSVDFSTIANAVLFFGIRKAVEGEPTFTALRHIKGVNPMCYHDWYGPSVTEMEAFPEGATKAKAIRRLAEKVGADRIVVFGDNRNDLSMMEVADWAVAVGNALDEVKEAADEVIGSNEADAVPRFILEEMNYT